MLCVSAQNLPPFFLLKRTTPVHSHTPTQAATTDASNETAGTRSHSDNGRKKKLSTVLRYSVMPLPGAVPLT